MFWHLPCNFCSITSCKANDSRRHCSASGSSNFIILSVIVNNSPLQGRLCLQILIVATKQNIWKSPPHQKQWNSRHVLGDNFGATNPRSKEKKQGALRFTDHCRAGRRKQKWEGSRNWDLIAGEEQKLQTTEKKEVWQNALYLDDDGRRHGRKKCGQKTKKPFHLWNENATRKVLSGDRRLSPSKVEINYQTLLPLHPWATWRT